MIVDFQAYWLFHSQVVLRIMYIMVNNGYRLSPHASQPLVLWNLFFRVTALIIDVTESASRIKSL